MLTNKNEAGNSLPNHSGNSHELIPFIQQGEELLVDARLLHQKLKIGRDFTNWIKDRIREYGFKLNEDYLIDNQLFAKFGEKLEINGLGRKPRTDYFLTPNMAKELCMLTNSAEGRKYRRYLITAEKENRETRIYGQVCTFTVLRKRVKTMKQFMNGSERILYSYRGVQELLGYSTKSSINHIKKLYGHLLLVQGKKSYVDESFVRLMITRATARKAKEMAIAAQPLLPLKFEEEKQKVEIKAKKEQQKLFDWIAESPSEEFKKLLTQALKGGSDDNN